MPRLKNSDRLVWWGGSANSYLGHHGSIFRGSQGIARRHHYDAGIGYVITIRAILLEVIADDGGFGDMRTGIDDGPADAAVTADLDIGHQDGVLDFAVAVDAHAGREHAAHHPGAGDDATGADDRVDRDTHAPTLLGEDEFSRRRLHHARPYGPLAVVEIELRRDGDQVQVGLVEGIDGAHVAPVACLLVINVAKIVSDHPRVTECGGKHVLAEVVGGIRVASVFPQNAQQHVRTENIDAHGGAHHIRVEDRGRGVAMAGLLLEADDAVVRPDLGDAETLGFPGVDLDGGDGDVGVVQAVPIDHLAIIHLVNVVGGEDQGEVGLFDEDALAILEDGIGGAEEPILADGLHGRDNLDKFAELGRQDVPAVADVPYQIERFVLC